MDRWELIDRLGSALGVKEHARAKWRERGVAHRYRLHMLRLAAQWGESLTDADFEGRRTQASQTPASTPSTAAA